jgi:hypothetical protein
MAINYQMDVVNPLEAAVQGLQLGQGLRQQQQQGALIQAQQAQAEAQRMKVEQEMAAAQRMQNDMAALYGKIDAGDWKASDVLKVISGNPALAQPIQQIISQQSAQQKEAGFNDLVRIFAEIETNNMPRAQASLEQQKAAYENSGDMDGAKVVDGMLQMLKSDPTAFKQNVAMQLAVLDPERFEQIVKAREAFMNAPAGREKAALEVENMAADLGLTQAQTAKVVRETQEVGARIGQIAAQVEAARNAGGGFLPPEDQMKAEDSLRTEVNKASTVFADARNAYEQMLVSRRLGTGAGDLALITMFRRILDPATGVRETEFAQTQNIGGILNKLDTYVSSLRSGNLLNEKTRSELMAQATAAFNAIEARQRKNMADYKRFAERRGLDPENVFLGASAPLPPPAPPAPPPPPPPAAQRFGGIVNRRPAPSGAQSTGRIVDVRKAGQ